MRSSIVNSLNERDRLLVLETEPAALRPLDEEALLELHARVRLARTKYVQLYRRGASAKVADSRGRGTAYGRSERNREVAEVFEGALARVSRQLAAAASAAERELRAERIAAARSGSAGPPPAGTARSASAGAGRRVPHAKTTGGVKRDASTRAAGARRQAKRDAG